MLKGAIIGPFINGKSGTLYRHYYYVKEAPKPISSSFAREQKKGFNFKRSLGMLCIGLSLAGASMLALPSLTPYLIRKDPGFQQVIGQAPSVPQTPTIKNFQLNIDKIGLKNAKVVREVDPSSKDDYKEALKEGLAHAQDSAYPNEGEMVYIFGHSTNYPIFVDDLNALLYKAETLERGDKIDLEFNGIHYEYFVTDKQIVNPRDLAKINAKSDEDILVLQTCYPPGTFWKRLLIFARPSQLNASFNQ